MHYGPLGDDRENVRIGRGFGEPPMPPAPRRRKGPVIAVVVAGGVALAAIVGLSLALVAATHGKGSTATTTAPARAAVATTPVAPAMVGTLSMPRFTSPHTAYDTANWKVNSIGSCEGLGGYSDIAATTSVTVYDGSGKIIGVSGLTFGIRHGQTCEWEFGVPNLPDEAFYQVEVAHRGKVAVQKADLAVVSLTLGD